METPEQKAQRIQQFIAENFHIKVNDLFNRRRFRRYSYPRMIAMYIVREVTGGRFPWVADRFGGVHHTSVMHACQWARDNLHYQEYIKDMLARFKKD